MQLGIFAKTFSGSTPAAVLSAAGQAGYQAVQYNLACSGLDPLPADIPAATAAAVRAASQETGVAIASVSATYNMIHPDPLVRERGRQGFLSIAASARAMGASLLTLCTGSCDPLDQWRFHPDNASPAAWRAMCREFELLLEAAETHDVYLGVEPELANVVSSASRARQLLDTFPRSRIRIVLDAANLFEVAGAEERRTLVEEAVDLLAADIALAHAKDRLPDGRFAAAGEGVLDYPHYLSTLRRAGFHGTLVTHGLDAADAPRVATFLRLSLEQAA